jgi:UDP-N-acetyl-2-amino-2-deoxyglucuronate dehydrogenase
MSRKLTIGFIGLGGIACVHAQALRELGHKVDFCATVSSSESRLREFSETYNCKGYMSYIEMLRQESPDIVLISSPHRLHAQIALEVIDAGAHLHMERALLKKLGIYEEVLAGKHHCYICGKTLSLDTIKGSRHAQRQTHPCMRQHGMYRQSL